MIKRGKQVDSISVLVPIPTSLDKQLHLHLFIDCHKNTVSVTMKHPVPIMDTLLTVIALNDDLESSDDYKLAALKQVSAYFNECQESIIQHVIRVLTDVHKDYSTPTVASYPDPAPARARWEQSEIEKMLDLYEARKTFEEIAAALNRTPTSVRLKLYQYKKKLKQILYEQLRTRRPYKS